MLAADSLSDDIEEGMGGTFIINILRLSEDAVLCRESDDEVLLIMWRDVSLFVVLLISLRGRTTFLGCGVVDRTG